MVRVIVSGGGGGGPGPQIVMVSVIVSGVGARPTDSYGKRYSFSDMYFVQCFFILINSKKLSIQAVLYFLLNLLM